ncbi:MAG: methylated-DNA--[protein]-cysteine S-methyltransferase [Candidatus Poribacteria bacterium]
MDIEFAVFQTEIGWIGIVGTEKGIVRSTLPLTDKESVLNLLTGIYGHKIELFKRSYFSDAIEMFKRYFKGRNVDFSLPIDFNGYTNFQIRIWEITKTIPYGELRSYKWVAHKIGNSKSARAVGQALASNPIPIIIPCHRVIASNGNLRGFTGGLELKEKLIKLEKGIFKNNGLTI